jgi:hypothetical protein
MAHPFFRRVFLGLYAGARGRGALHARHGRTGGAGVPGLCREVARWRGAEHGSCFQARRGAGRRGHMVRAVCSTKAVITQRGAGARGGAAGARGCSWKLFPGAQGRGERWGFQARRGAGFSPGLRVSSVIVNGARGPGEVAQGRGVAHGSCFQARRGAGRRATRFGQCARRKPLSRTGFNQGGEFVRLLAGVARPAGRRDLRHRTGSHHVGADCPKGRGADPKGTSGARGTQGRTGGAGVYRCSAIGAQRGAGALDRIPGLDDRSYGARG